MSRNHVGLAIDPATNDLYLEADGNLAMVEDAEAVGQHVRQRLKTFAGEWFIDKNAGVKWLTEVLGRRYDPALAEALIKAEILRTDGVTEITSFSVRFDRVERRLAGYSININTIYGEASA
jgi:hypothetical protein